jgi:CTP:molybdopterin cytidylyltransferase MocA
VQLPADHPLVTALAAQKAENAGLRARAAKVESSAVAAALKEHMVALHQIDADDAELLLTGDNPELLLKQVARLLEQRPKKKAVVAREGGNPDAAQTGDMREFARGLFGRSD